jgi:hypothetical protein
MLELPMSLLARAIEECGYTEDQAFRATLYIVLLIAITFAWLAIDATPLME